jgi:SNF2 family DNA or RNA helicase
MTIHAKREPRLGVTKKPFPFQVDAVESVKGLPFAAIFHEQGLGKTKIAIDLGMTWLQSDVVDSIMIVTKKGLVRNWQREFAAHTYMNPTVLDQNRSGNYFKLNSPARVYLTHYEVCLSERDRFALFLKTRRVAVILDESHKIKNPEGAMTKALLSLSQGFVRRVIMTGTPVANRPYDIWAQIKFLDDGKSLGNDFRSFKTQLDLTRKLVRDPRERVRFERMLSWVFQQIAAFTVRETKETAGIALPNKEIRSKVVELEDAQADLYNNLKRDLRAVIIRDGLPVLEEVDEVLKRLLRLVQVASNPRLLDQSYDREPGKAPWLRNIVHDAVSAGSKVIVWSSFTENVDWLSTVLGEYGAVRLHGKLPMEARDRAVEVFQGQDGCRVLVATPGAAKEGLTLTAANYAVFYDRSFSLDDYLQAQDRIHRISQTKPCIIYNLIAKDTVDEWVGELLAAKHLAAQLVQGDITQEEYHTRATYEFARLLSEVLGIEHEGPVNGGVE